MIPKFQQYEVKTFPMNTKEINCIYQGVQINKDRIQPTDALKVNQLKPGGGITEFKY